MDSATHTRSRPPAVTLAVILLTVGMTAGVLRGVIGVHFSKPVLWLLLAAVAVVPYLVIWFIFRGKNWARWVFLIMFVLAICSLSVSPQRLLAQSAFDIILYCGRLLLGLIAAGALFSPSSTEWFRGNKNES